jgi:sulfate adenylyltransferase subunit 1
VFWLDPRALEAGARVLVKSGTATIQALVTEVSGRRSLETLALEPATGLSSNDIGEVTIRLATELPLERFEQHRRGGAFLVIHPQSGATLAAGTVISTREGILQ